ncbi:MAG: squalene synthase HpnD [Sulfobacillus acidophilus]|uniref:Squalene synthase HpnD n=1 Tax=Sulfobacillus acidophilus TaxID=53633 RepID=A0A2T2WH24_9FIRM|nr:MAG: squalene synthase HpnD [Sulfobacillus acidophilus]
MDRIADAYHVCSERVKHAGSSFYYGMRLLPTDKRLAIYAVYAWSRICDDAVDDYSGSEAQQHLSAAEMLYQAAYAEQWRQAAHPVSIALGDAIRRYHLSRDAFAALVAGMQMDLAPRLYQTFADLEQYCLKVAGAIGTLCVEVFGFTDDRARELAAKLGVALQLTNIIRDIKEDAQRGRCYLPLEDLDRHGVTANDILQAHSSPELIRLLTFEAQRAKRYYQEAVGLVDLVDADSVRCLKLLYGIYYLLLQKMEDMGFDVWSTRVQVSRREALKLMGGTFWQAIG